MDNIRVAVWGFGAMGGGIAKVLLEKKGVEITGVCDIHPARVGKSIFELLGVERGERRDVTVCDDINKVAARGAADICVIATDSFTKKVFPKIKLVVENGINVICTAEEMSYPKANQPELAEEMDKLAKANGVSILGPGDENSLTGTPASDALLYGILSMATKRLLACCQLVDDRLLSSMESCPLCHTRNL